MSVRIKYHIASPFQDSQCFPGARGLGYVKAKLKSQVESQQHLVLDNNDTELLPFSWGFHGLTDALANLLMSERMIEVIFRSSRLMNTLRFPKWGQLTIALAAPSSFSRDGRG